MSAEESQRPPKRPFTAVSAKELREYADQLIEKNEGPEHIPAGAAIHVLLDQYDSFTAPKTEEQLAKEMWASFGWARMRDEEDQNPDRIPDNFNVNFACPKCGSVWGELRALGFAAPRVLGGTASFLASIPMVRPEPMLSILGVSSYSAVPRDGVRAARLVCLEGHVIDFDVPSGRKRVVEVPAYMPWIVTAGIMSLGILAYAYGLGKKTG